RLPKTLDHPNRGVAPGRQRREGRNRQDNRSARGAKRAREAQGFTAGETHKLGISAKQLEQLGASVLELVPSKRFGKADEVAQVIAFLASGAASYVNGAEY